MVDKIYIAGSNIANQHLAKIAANHIGAEPFYLQDELPEVEKGVFHLLGYSTDLYLATELLAECQSKNYTTIWTPFYQNIHYIGYVLSDYDYPQSLLSKSWIDFNTQRKALFNVLEYVDMVAFTSQYEVGLLSGIWGIPSCMQFQLLSPFLYQLSKCQQEPQYTISILNTWDMMELLVLLLSHDGLLSEMTLPPELSIHIVSLSEPINDAIYFSKYAADLQRIIEQASKRYNISHVTVDNWEDALEELNKAVAVLCLNYEIVNPSRFLTLLLSGNYVIASSVGCLAEYLSCHVLYINPYSASSIEKAIHNVWECSSSLNREFMLIDLGFPKEEIAQQNKAITQSWADLYYLCTIE